MDGIINVLKPSGMTSHDVVSFIRRTLNKKKVGHTGTLDPNAAGVLPICIGKGTKISQYLLDDKKKYRAELTLGIQTDTQDRYGSIINSSDLKVTEEEIINAFNEFKGVIYQIPPMFSALKHKGKKLYELARENKTIKREPRKITIYSLDIINILNNKIIFDVNCSKGTYIRTLCNDIGNKLNTFGHMSALIRTEVGVFNLYNSNTLEDIKSKAENGIICDIINPVDFPLTYYKDIIINEKYYSAITNGVKVPLLNINVDNNELEKYKVYCRNIFIGIGKIIKNNDDYYLKMEKMLL